ncbi:hypothetical protein QVD17_09915 [Tagetes erecta]|uniref:Uncharacterized protein n=1 Tax=Tagetes erecta TaxID=13708 RepID=A0AAD8L5I7_TARER|nr:hypothetical protein QVD17_09915 [Tagetes erecta]
MVAGVLRGNSIDEVPQSVSNSSQIHLRSPSVSIAGHQDYEQEGFCTYIITLQGEAGFNSIYLVLNDMMIKMMV